MCSNCLLDPKMDFIFKRIFGNENHPDILIRFLNAIFESKDTSGDYDPIISVEIKTTEIPKDSYDSKASILDIRAKTSRKEIINIEIQRKDEGNILERALYYLCKMFTEQLGSGGKYEELERSVAIVITDFKTDFIKNPDFHTCHSFADDSTFGKLTDKLELHFIELPKMEKFNEDDVLQLFLQFLKNPQDVKVQEKSIDVKELSKAKSELQKLSVDPDMRYEYELRERTIKDINSMMSTREAKGIAKGIAKGMEQGRVEGIEETKLSNAKNLLNILDDETIASTIGLDVQAVKNLRADNL